MRIAIGRAAAARVGRAIGFGMLLLASRPAWAEAPSYSWGRAFGGTGFDDVADIAHDEAGNAYVTGTVEGSVDLDGDGTAEVSRESPSLFVAKFGSTGGLQWYHVLAGTYSVGKGIVVSPAGRVFVAGYFKGTVEFPFPSAVGSIDCPCPFDSSYAALVLGYETYGTLEWARSFDGTRADPFAVGYARDIALVGGFLTVAGSFWRGLDTDGDGDNDVTSRGQEDAYLASLFALTGNVQWFQPIRGESQEVAAHVAAGLTAVVVSGYFQDRIDFGDGEDKEHSGLRSFLAGYDIWDGRFLWYRVDFEDSLGSDVAWSHARSVFYQLIEDRRLTRVHGAFSLVQFSESGEPERRQWFESAAGTVLPGALTVDADGDVYVAGSFDAPLTLGSTAHPTRGSFDVFLASYSWDGLYRWSTAAGGAGMDLPFAVAIDPWRRPYLAGWFRSAEMHFDDTAGAELASHGSQDGFLAIYGFISWECDPTWSLDGVPICPVIRAEYRDDVAELQLTALHNVVFKHLYARDPLNGVFKDVTADFARQNCGGNGGECVRFVYRGTQRRRELFVGFGARDRSRSLRFTAGGRDVRQRLYRHPPVELPATARR